MHGLTTSEWDGVKRSEDANKKTHRVATVGFCLLKISWLAPASN